MRMLGITDIRDLHPGLLNTRDIDHLVPDDDGEENPYAGRRSGAVVRAREKLEIVGGLDLQMCI